MRRLAGGILVVLGAVLLLNGGMAAAAGPSDPISQEVAVNGSAPDAGLLVFSSRSRNTSCSVTRNVLNRSGAEVGFRVLDADGTVLDQRRLGASAQVTFVIDHTVVTVPLLLQVGDDAPVELAGVGPFAPCDPPATTVPSSTPSTPSTPTTPTTTSTPSTSTPPPSSVPGTTSPPTVTTLSPGPTPPPSVGTATTVAVGGPSTTVATAAPASTAPPVSVLAARVTVPADGSIGRLPTTGGTTRPTVILGLSAIAVGLAFLVTARSSRRLSGPATD